MDNYSVLMSVYKNEKPDHFLKSLKSMFQQTFLTDDFVLVVDGEIGEDLETIISQYENEFPNVFHVFRIEKNHGLGHALNFGLTKCKHNLVARMDSDDISLPTRCEEQIRYFKSNPNTSVVGTQIIDFSDSNSFYKHTFPIEHSDIRKYLKQRCPFGHPSVMFKKDKVLEAGNYDETMKNQQDYNLWIRMSNDSNNVFHNLNKVLLLMRNDDSIFSRRGGMKYFKLGMINQKLLLKLKLINKFNYIVNTFERFTVQVLMIKSVRKIIYRKVLRKSALNDEKIIHEVKKYL